MYELLKRPNLFTSDYDEKYNNCGIYHSINDIYVITILKTAKILEVYFDLGDVTITTKDTSDLATKFRLVQQLIV
ncbi:hypothetical protein J2T20_002630 [Paenibacillus wynnii]|nr:hypothetical protein [Paenibacillus wynnii]